MAALMEGQAREELTVSVKIDKKVNKNKTKLTIMSLILLLAVFFIMISQTTIFNVKKITVEGNREISKDKIVLASGIVMGENIFKLDIKNAKENLLLHPYISDVKIKRKLPNKLVMKISEREEVATINHLDSYVYIGFDGLILDILKEKKDNKTPLVSGLAIAHPSIGSNIIYKRKNKKQSNDIEDFIEKCSEKGLKEKTNSITFSGQNINIILNSGVNIAFGAPDNIEYKLKFLLEVLKDIEKKDIKARNIFLNKSSDIIIEVVGS